MIGFMCLMIIIQQVASLIASKVQKATKLHLACRTGNVTEVKRLLDTVSTEKELWKKDTSGDTPLDDAVNGGQLLCTIILCYADVLPGYFIPAGALNDTVSQFIILNFHNNPFQLKSFLFQGI